MNIVLFGPPGSGKGTQAIRLENNLGITRITTGDILRQAAESSDEIKQILSEGNLVSNELICQLVLDRLQQDDCQAGCLFDGFPRTVQQAQFLLQHGITIDCFIELEVNDESIVERLSGRRVHLPSGRTYHIDALPPRVEGIDDVTGEPLSVRSDDQPDRIRNRLKVYHEETAPVKAFYNDQSNTVMHSVDGMLDQELIEQNIRDLLNH